MKDTRELQSEQRELRCSLCDGLPDFHCVNCGDLFCLEHAPAGPVCGVCEARIARLNWLAIGLSLALVAPVVALAAGVLNNALLLFGVFIGSTAIGGVLGAGPMSWLVRRIAKVRVEGETLLQAADQSRLQIGPGRASRSRRVRVRGGTGGSAGALPEVPIYQRNLWSG